MDDSATLDPVTTSDGPVRVERTLEVRERGVIAVFSITCAGERPMRVTVVDYLPGNWRVDEIGFRHENRPDDGTATSDTVRFEVTVEPGEEALVVYGVTLGATIDVDAVARAQDFSKPRIASVEPVGTEHPHADEGAPGRDEAGVRGETAERVVETDEDGEAYPDDPAAFFERFRSSSGRQEGDVGPPETERRPGEDAGDEADSGEPARGDRPEDRPLAAVLADEIEAGDVDDEAVGRLREALARKDRASTRTRLQRIESKQEEFGAYVDALRELIDEHGPAAEFVGDLLASIEVMEVETAALRDEVEAAADGRAEIRRELSTETDALGDRLDAVEDDVEDAEEAVDALADALAEATDTASSLESEVSALADDIESLRDRVDAWESTRRRLLDALETRKRSDPSERPDYEGEPDDGDV